MKHFLRHKRPSWLVTADMSRFPNMFPMLGMYSSTIALAALYQTFVMPYVMAVMYVLVTIMRKCTFKKQIWTIA